MYHQIQRGCYLSDGTYLKPGLYPLVRKTKAGIAYHHGLLDVGNCSGYSEDGEPIVLHMLADQGGLCKDPFYESDWQYLGKKVPDSQQKAVIARINIFRNTDIDYKLFFNNCEHFVRYVITGKKESKQVQDACTITAIISAPFIVSWCDKKLSGQGKQ